MEPVEIIFVLIGVAILIASCFIEKKEDKPEAVVTIPEEVLEAQKLEMKKYAEQLLEDKSEEIIVKTDDYLSKVSNEKIMSVNDFSTQLLEKIDVNHKEVVFLYDMLNQKEDEIKQTVQQFNQEKQQLQEVVGDVVRLTRQIKATIKKTDTAKAAVPVEKAKKPETKKPVSTPAEPVKATENKSDGQLEFTELMQADKQKEEVLRLYKQGKSVLEISKAMGMGQGEVKLIIGLYGA